MHVLVIVNVMVVIVVYPVTVLICASQLMYFLLLYFLHFKGGGNVISCNYFCFCG